MGLSDRDRSILEFERQWWHVPGSKEQAIRERFGLSTVAYYQAVNRLIDEPAAAAFDAQLVRRLDRLRRRKLAALN